MIVVIDDERTFEFTDTAVYARTSQEAISRLANTAILFDQVPIGAIGEITQMFFDHDLGEDSEADGVVVARFVGILVRGCPDLFRGCKFYIHSQNPVGAKNIFDALKFYGIDAQVIPLPPLKKA